MTRSLLLIMLGCTANPAPPMPSIPAPAPPTPVACPAPLAETPFRWLAQRPQWAHPPTEASTRLYGGRLRLPLELRDAAVHDLYVMGTAVEVTGVEETADDIEVLFQGEASCDGRCDHAWITLGGPDGPVILLVPTPRTGDLTGLVVTLQTTARMALGLSAGGQAAIAAPINPGDRRDLDRFVEDVVAGLVDDLIISGSSGITVHGVPLPGTEVIATIDAVLGDQGPTAPAFFPAPWLFPLAQPRVDTALTLWSTRGRSDPIPPSDGRFAFILGEDLTTEETWVARFTGADSQSTSTVYRWPPPAVGGLQVRRVAGALEVSNLVPGGWLVVRALHEVGPPVVCEVGPSGVSLLDGLHGALEVVHTNLTGGEIVAHTTCEQGSGALLCR